MHPGKQVPVELFGCHCMERDGFDRTALAVRHHTSDDLLRLLDQPVNSLIGHMLADGLVFGRRRSTPQSMAENSLLGSESQRILSWPPLALWPVGDDAGHIIDKTVYSSLPMVAMRSFFSHHKQMALVRHAQCPLQCPENNLIDIRIWIGMLVDQQPFGSRLEGTSEGQVPRSRSHYF